MCSRRLRSAVEATSSRWLTGVASVSDLVETIAAVYADGYGELAIALHAAGWRHEGRGFSSRWLTPCTRRGAARAAGRRAGSRPVSR